jgi:hypothetical protein
VIDWFRPEAALQFSFEEKMKPIALSDQELRQRLPVWEALSEFWLDTELTETQLEGIAQAIASSPYSVLEVRLIHDYEVAPALYPNLLSMAGEWAGFDTDWLRARCMKTASKRGSYSYKVTIFLQRPAFWFFTARHWRVILPRVQKLREL